MGAEAKVAGHYAKPKLEETILQALQKAGKDLANLNASDLAPVDEFHVGGIEATRELAEQMEVRPGMRLLDIGCGLGGPARYLASEKECRVDGIDLTEEFISVAKSLTRLVKLEHLAEFQQASASALPFELSTFDRAYMIHVGMNIADKSGVFREVRRVLKPGARFTIFDVMRGGDGAIQYPVPWAQSEETSFVADLKSYRGALEAAGFRVEKDRDRTQFSVEFTEKMMARIAQEGPPVLGLHLVLGQNMPAMIRSIQTMLKQGTLVVVELYARAA